MKNLLLLISPQAKSAYFNDYIDVAKAELCWLIGGQEVEHRRMGEMDFLAVASCDVSLQQLARLSFIYGIFEQDGDKLLPLSAESEFSLHENFVFGSKFKGKTNELLTQMLINVGLKSIDYRNVSELKLLDPMCGRATTLLWAMRYGIKAKGIEQDVKAIADVRMNIKKWCKVQRQKHSFKEGFIGKANKHDKGKFIDFDAADSSMRMINGDSTEANTLLKNEKFDLLVSDLPYGVQHFTTDKTRDPISVLKDCVEAWSKSLKINGVIVLSFNRYLPRREKLIGVFESEGFSALDFSAEHRMSESIVRDVVILRKLY
ncbi:hypothetical protein SIN8267_02600 [Sinobacterium norvegicum]|uniref:Uncharacterized protein n=1 Tax=Sinobacterium norvegicum TaxID=1641715 RepID=A0ABM9AGX8_9GAMM|nr:hypothetical protein [Sinobacterium norvegicum]CAH0992474.1 hypothetical protein SIN8267_02600 [Sinobacterium norvegicum]